MQRLFSKAQSNVKERNGIDGIRRNVKLKVFASYVNKKNCINNETTSCSEGSTRWPPRGEQSLGVTIRHLVGSGLTAAILEIGIGGR